MEPLVVGSWGAIRSLLYYGVLYGVVVGVAYWIYRDAAERGSRYALAWAAATLVFTIIPVVVYMYVHWQPPSANPEAG